MEEMVMLILLIPIGIWLVAMDRQARQRPIAEQTTQLRPVLRSEPVRRRP
jgi:hypothetical protein